MAFKEFDVEGIGNVRITKRSDARHLRLSISPQGQVRISIPAWARYQEGVEFAEQRREWILAHRPKTEALITNLMRVGKAHRYTFTSADTARPSARLSGSDIHITRPLILPSSDREVQTVARRAGIRALRAEAAHLLPQRLRTIAAEHNFTYSSVGIKQLKGRWGSCDSHQNIVFNLYLMQLPWELIDYVIMHELIHTKHLHHGKEFWDEFLRHQPSARSLQKSIKQHQPILTPFI